MDSGVSIRQASSQEIGELKLLVINDPDKSLCSVTRDCAGMREVVFLIDFKGETAGFITWRDSAQEIFPLALFTPYRRRGIGTIAAKKFVQIQCGRGVDRLIIDIVEGKEDFWAKVFSGFNIEHIVDRKYYVYLTQAHHLKAQ